MSIHLALATAIVPLSKGMEVWEDTRSKIEEQVINTHIFSIAIDPIGTKRL